MKINVHGTLKCIDMLYIMEISNVWNTHIRMVVLMTNIVLVIFINKAQINNKKKCLILNKIYYVLNMHINEDFQLQVNVLY